MTELIALQPNRLITGDCLAVLHSMPTESVSMAITSPPYWGLRDYGSETATVFGGKPECQHEWNETPPPRKRSENDVVNPNSLQNGNRGANYNAQIGSQCYLCGAWKGQLGLEPHPQLYIDHLVEIFRELRRVLAKDGSFYLNMGDTYYASGGAGGDYLKGGMKEGQPTYRQNSSSRNNWLRPKQKLMIPARLAIAMQDDGWLLRNDIIWYKRNHMPSSVKDRLSCAYEHIFFFVKSERYYYDLDAIREPFDPSTIGRITQPNVMSQTGGKKQDLLRGSPESGNASRCNRMVQSLALKESTCPESLNSPRARTLREGYDASAHFYDPNGKNPGDVFQSNKEPYLSNNPHTMRLNAERYVSLDPSRSMDLSDPNGKNPGDVIQYNKQKFRDGALGKYTGIFGKNRPDSHGTELNHPDGANPGDVISDKKWATWDDKVPRRLMRYGQGQTVETLHRDGGGVYHPNGCNPTDTWKLQNGDQSTCKGINEKGHSGYFDKDGNLLVNADGPNPSDFWDITTRAYPEAHFATFPPMLCVRPILASCPPNGIVLDIFAGSGTTCAVAKALGRNYLGIEINPKYVELANQRINKVIKPLSPVLKVRDAEKAINEWQEVMG